LYFLPYNAKVDAVYPTLDWCSKLVYADAYPFTRMSESLNSP
jgi:hypothetical protein